MSAPSCFVGFLMIVASPVPKKSIRSSVFRTRRIGLLYSKETALGIIETRRR
ncbi:hypothetical protein CPAR01_14856 [Colletotrichum paranaense]|uniref:Uncharacterized protein n=1 Tax=Colletotrichum paranaense TaxID=1914294 RepID=A0ABQ9S039_9PEZI|nr:uncharacterized protein CPAR01_14856 [Colletotrichum paranaense]KAK1521333.1 hypothetical protein CPAR01_14856 [Colletotrichum paranaense]